MSDALSRTVRLLESLGHQVEEVTVDLGADREEFVLADARLLTANPAASVDELAGAFDRPVDSSTLEPVALAGHHHGQRVSCTQFVAVLAIRNRVARTLAHHFDSHGILLTPTVPALPVPLGTYAEGAEALDGPGWIRRVFDRSPFTMPFNVAGTPALPVPVTADSGTGLPVGMQFAAGYGLEGRPYRFAGQLEQVGPGRSDGAGRTEGGAVGLIDRDGRWQMADG